MIWRAAENLSHRHQDTMTRRGTKPTIDAFTDLVRLRGFVSRWRSLSFQQPARRRPICRR